MKNTTNAKMCILTGNACNVFFLQLCFVDVDVEINYVCLLYILYCY